MMRDDVGLSVCRPVSQHSTITQTPSKQEPDHSKTLPPHHIQDTYVQSLQGDLLSHTNQTGALQSSIQHWSSAFNRSLLSRPLNSQKPKGPSDPCVKDRHTFLQALEAFFHFFATRSSQHLHGNTLVYLNNLYQMYPLDIQQPSKESPGELLIIFFLRTG